MHEIVQFTSESFSLLNPLFHSKYCRYPRGTGPCLCERKRVEFRRSVFVALYELAKTYISSKNQVIELNELHPRHPFHQRGRPNKYSVELLIQFGLLQVVGNPACKQAEALKLCNISRSTMKRWRRQNSAFDELLSIIQSGRKTLPQLFPKRVLNRCACTRYETKKICRPMCSRSGFSPCFANQVKSSIRKTAESLGVSPTTVFRWAKDHYREFGYFLYLERIKASLLRFNKYADQIAKT